jgi:hypothetical protein
VDQAIYNPNQNIFGFHAGRKQQINIFENIEKIFDFKQGDGMVVKILCGLKLIIESNF